MIILVLTTIYSLRLGRGRERGRGKDEKGERKGVCEKESKEEIRKKGDMGNEGIVSKDILLPNMACTQYQF